MDVGSQLINSSWSEWVKVGLWPVCSDGGPSSPISESAAVTELTNWRGDICCPCVQRSALMLPLPMMPWTLVHHYTITEAELQTAGSRELIGVAYGLQFTWLRRQCGDVTTSVFGQIQVWNSN